MLAVAGMSDPVSSMTHLAGALACATRAGALLRSGRGSGARLLSLGLFAFCCVLLLALSGAYHLLAPDTAAKALLKRLDHAAIFMLIAASFTPVHAILFRGAWRWGMLAGIWSAAGAGLIVKTAYFDVMPEWVGLSMYLGLGWLGVISAVALARRYGLRFIQPVLWGALAYTAGALAEFHRWPLLVPGFVGPHEVLHLAVLAGIACHWVFIARIAAGGTSGPGWIRTNDQGIMRESRPVLDSKPQH